MKRIITTALLSALALSAAELHQSPDEKLALIKEYKEMFDRISQQRKGVSERTIEALAEPFVAPEKKPVKVKPTPKKGEVKPKEPEYRLQAIFNNRAKISGSWYGIGDEVHGMKLIAIKGNVVWLKNSSFRKRLTLRKENAKITIN